MVRVPQVVHRVHERLVVLGEFGDDVLQLLRADRVESEMDVEDVEFLVVVAHPARFENQRRPPAPGTLRPSAGTGSVNRITSSPSGQARCRT